SYARNLAFNEGDISDRATDRAGVRRLETNNWECAVALNADGSCDANQDIFDSGDTAWLTRFSIGTPEVKSFGDWSFSAAYRYVEGDALLDAFVDSDFALGGTNAQGYIVGGAFGLTNNTVLGARWLSATEISGPSLAVDVLQIDVGVKF